MLLLGMCSPPGTSCPTAGRRGVLRARPGEPPAAPFEPNRIVTMWGFVVGLIGGVAAVIRRRPWTLAVAQS